MKGCSEKPQTFFSIDGMLWKGLLAKNAALRAVLTATLPYFPLVIILWDLPQEYIHILALYVYGV